MDINEKLKEAGLTGNEAKVYLELLRNGSLSANQLAKNLGIDRTLTYTILSHIIEKGQANCVIKESKKLFQATNPENLLNAVKEKEIVIKELISELRKIKTRKQEETEINVYEGKEGIRVLIKELQKIGSFDTFGATGRAYNLLFEAAPIAKQAEKRQAQVRLITNKKYKGEEFIKYKFLKVKFIDIESEATTCIFKDKISIHLIKGKPVVIIIKNKDIANSYRNYFNYLWKRAS